MKVTIETEGGIAAGLNRRSVVVDTDRLRPEDVKELDRLVGAAKAEEAPTGLVRLGEKIIIEDAGQETELARSIADLAGSPAFAALRSWVRSKASA